MNPSTSQAAEQGYTFEEAKTIIDTFYSRVFGQHLTIDTTPTRVTISGTADGFLALPYKPSSHSFDMELLQYSLSPMKEEWLAAKRREAHRWLPLVRIAGQHVALVPVLVSMHIWDESWR